MSREEGDSGSLDLLLDTLCNTFGGIILIALLLAVSVNDKSKELYDKELKMDANSTELLERELADLNATFFFNEDAQEDKIKDVDEEILDLEEEIENLRQDIDDLNDEEKALEVLVEKSGRELESLREDTVEANATQLTTQEAIARMETILEHQRLSKELAKKPYKEIGLPQAKTSTRTPLYVIVAYGRMYPMYIVTRGRVRPNETDIQWSETAEGDTVVRPDPARGIDPEKDKQRFDDFLKVVKEAPNLVQKELLLQMFVNADSESFALFNEIRDEIVLRGISYNWAPTNELPIQFEKGAVQAISLD